MQAKLITEQVPVTTYTTKTTGVEVTLSVAAAEAIVAASWFIGGDTTHRRAFCALGRTLREAGVKDRVGEIASRQSERASYESPNHITFKNPKA